MNNPFDLIDARLRNLECLVLDLKHNPTVLSSNQEDLLTIQQAAKILNVSTSTIYGYVHRREIPFNKPSGVLYFSKQELTEWIKAGKKKIISELQEDAKASFVNKKRLNNGK